MADPWLHIVGLGEDGGNALPDASRLALARAEFVFGGARHLALVAGLAPQAQHIAWRVPFDVAPLLELAGRQVVALASGDPFWFGAGTVLADHMAHGAWTSHPAPSSFALAANHLGWAIQRTLCHGLHAAPLPRIRADLQHDARLIVTLRDGAAARELADYLCGLGFGASPLWLLSRLGGPQEVAIETRADAADLPQLSAPIMAAIHARGTGLPRGFGLPDDLFLSDGQITKAQVRAMTLAALAPRDGARLWDIGGGSGSISVEWCLNGGQADCIESRADRCANITGNAAAFGVDHRLNVTQGAAPQALVGLPAPDAVFVGGGGNAALFQAIWPLLPQGCRLVANAVTLESEALLMGLCAQHGGHLTRIDIAQTAPLGGFTAWAAARPIVQWSVQA